MAFRPSPCSPPAASPLLNPSPSPVPPRRVAAAERAHDPADDMTATEAAVAGMNEAPAADADRAHRAAAASRRTDELHGEARRHALGHLRGIPQGSVVLARDLADQSAGRESAPHLSGRRAVAGRRRQWRRPRVHLAVQRRAPAAASAQRRARRPGRHHSVLGDRGIPVASPASSRRTRRSRLRTSSPSATST